MTKTQYRTLLLLSFAVGIVGGLLDILLPSLVADALRQAQAAHDAELSLARLLLASTFALPGVGMMFISTYGLYQFKPWAPRVGLIGTALALLSSPAFGTGVQSGISASISFAASYLWGAALVLPLVAPYNSWFAKPAER